MNIISTLLTSNPYSRPQTKLAKVTKIALHYVGNAGSTAVANRNYFESLKDKKTTYASSHYIIGLDGEIIQCVPESEVAYCTNQANSYSISIENCHPSADGKFTDKTYAALVELCADLCRRHVLNPLVDIIRHYDVTGKACPLYYVNNPAAWVKLLQDINNYMNRKEVIEMRYNKIDELPAWARPTIQKLMDKGHLTGDDKGNLNLSEDMVRILVIHDRAGVYK